MTDTYDSIIVGAGHNGLVCAATLAKAGRRVLVVEASEQVGGAAITREIASGYKVSACAHILHLLHGNLCQRGGGQETHMGSMTMEIIEDLTPCCDVKVSVRIDKPVTRVTLEPQGEEIPFHTDGDRVEFEIDRFTCHQMVALA